MAQKRFSITQGDNLSDVVVATDATSLSGASARLIVVDTVSQKEVLTFIETLKKRFLQENYPF